MTKKLAAIIIALGLSALLVVTVTQSKAKEPPRDILGIQIGMSFDDAHKRLEKIGRLDREERKRQEVWVLTNDRRFSHLIIGFDQNGGVRYVTVLAREGKQVRYSHVLDTKKAKVTSGVKNYHYTWEVAARDKRPGYQVMAQGSDPDYLSSYSLKKLNDQ